MNEDLRQARALLEQGAYTCVLCRSGETEVCTARGVRPLLDLLERGSWAGFSAADKVVGKATAFLYILLGIRAVYTPVASEQAVRVLGAHGVALICDRVVPAIANREGTGLCPMESAVREIEEPAAALAAIRCAYDALCSR